ASGKPLLIVSHMDTVWALGTIDGEVPLKLEDGRLHGPGALDMKGGIEVALRAIEGLVELNQLPECPIWYLATSDEEIGSKQSRAIIEEKAQEAALVLVTEPPTADGALKTWRKGVASYVLTIEGQAAHAGNEPEKGINSVIEFAQQALELHQLNDYKNGTSVSVTVVNGGTATNVIPSKTVAHIDTRVLTVKDYNRVYEKIMERAPFIAGSKVTIEQRHYRPPMERNATTFEQARDIAKAVGITIREDGAGGGSDGNFTAALGIPTLDGLGPEGSGLHAPHEHVLVNTMPQKAAMIAAILRDWSID
ncbi:MAG: M20/M25/M40 family metallo-hydrolase, partial [Anaerolineae bacterium]|nr:M20/M25/M40 family metallo-hydrolase [Anaerolineae bacterium]